MKIETFKVLISSLPVRQQSFTTKRSTWTKAETETDWLSSINDHIFDKQETVSISRQDIFNASNSIKESILKTIYWGYTGGMRGNHFINILKKIHHLEIVLEDLKNKTYLTSQDFVILVKELKNISGLGLSTYSKILYFLDIKFNNNPCLILDQRLIDVFAQKSYDDFDKLQRINYSNAENKYLDYLEITNNISQVLMTSGENIEQFLFIFGNNLKLDNFNIQTKR